MREQPRLRETPPGFAAPPFLLISPLGWYCEVRRTVTCIFRERRQQWGANLLLGLLYPFINLLFLLPELLLFLRLLQRVHPSAAALEVGGRLGDNSQSAPWEEVKGVAGHWGLSSAAQVWAGGQR